MTQVRRQRVFRGEKNQKNPTAGGGGWVAGLARRASAARSRESSAALLPPEPYLDRLVKYERHLHAQLTSTLHELERLQGRRAGAPVTPPAVADVHVTVNQD